MAQISLKQIVILGFVLRFIAACISHRYYQPDEHFQVLEPAYGWVHGVWLKTWEWERGVRSWFFPGLLIPPLALMKALRIENPWIVGAVIRTLMGMFSLLSIVFSYRLSRLYLSDLWSKGFAVFFAVTPALIFFGVRTQPESVSMTLGLIGLVWILESIRSRSEKENLWIFFAGLVSGLSYLFRFQSGVFTLSLGLILLFEKRNKGFFIFSFGVLFFLIFQGWIDSFTWGSWFHSSIEYVRFNLIENGAANWFGHKPWHKLMFGIGRMFGHPIMPLLYGFAIYAIIRDRKRLFPVALVVFVFQGFHHFLSHKEDRFLIPILPELLFLACVGYSLALKNTKSLRWKKGFLLFCTVLFCLTWFARSVTWNWGWMSPEVLRTYRLGQDPDMRGVLQIGSGMHETGGYFYFSKTLPFRVVRDPTEIKTEEIGRIYNRVVVANRLDYPGEKLMTSLRLKEEKDLSCVLDPELGADTWKCERKNPSN